MSLLLLFSSFFFFFNDTATTEIYTLSLHDALPISGPIPRWATWWCSPVRATRPRDRKSTRLNSSHLVISYAVFCLKKKNKLDSYSLLTQTTKYKYFDFESNSKS